MRFLRRWWRLFSQGWHWHLCGCGEAFLCSRRLCDREEYICVPCETAQVEKWIADFHPPALRRIK